MLISLKLLLVAPRQLNHDELESDEGEKAPEDSVQNDDSSLKIDMGEGNEETYGEDAVGVALKDHPNDKDNNEPNDNQSTSHKKNPSLEEIVSSGRLHQFPRAGKHLRKA
ncbi:hypothetical protein HHI36_023462 [Cryptolaemus montrouzieri]|uniref:Uncharacterized protein n=1 Tax=Cryptolaemus montrouzieri TaxID=559131 RepID=A0ABD2PH37_9CUCU